MSVLRRYEILLPQSLNDGTSIPREGLADALLELRARFGAVSCETQVIQGSWEFQGTVFHDDLVRVFVDVTDTPANREFFVQFKERLKERFQQLDIWLTTYPIESL